MHTTKLVFDEHLSLKDRASGSTASNGTSSRRHSAADPWARAVSYPVKCSGHGPPVAPEGGPSGPPPCTLTDANPTKERTAATRDLVGWPPDPGQPSPALEDWEGKSSLRPSCVTWAWWGVGRVVLGHRSFWKP